MVNHKNQDLHGNVPDHAPTALVIIDMLSCFEFPGGRALLPQARAMAKRLAELKAAFRKRKFPVVYANDNFGRWRSSQEALVHECLSEKNKGRDITSLIQPTEEDYFVLKPKHSAFYETGLDLLLQHLGVQNLVLTGMAGDNCVYFTASDAYLRDYDIFVPGDCVISIDPEENKDALKRMRRILKVDTAKSATLLRQTRLFRRDRSRRG